MVTQTEKKKKRKHAEGGRQLNPHRLDDFLVVLLICWLCFEHKKTDEPPDGDNDSAGGGVFTISGDIKFCLWGCNCSFFKKNILTYKHYLHSRLTTYIYDNYKLQKNNGDKKLVYKFLLVYN